MPDTTNVICPGQAAMFEDDAAEAYLRMVFTVYWQDACPSTEIFYLKHGFRLNPTSIGQLEAYIIDFLKKEGVTNTPLATVYICYSGVELTDQDVSDLGSRIIGGHSLPPAVPILSITT